MNQVSSVPFGTDATVFSGYAESANERLGNLSIVFENVGPNTAYIRLAQYDGSTSPSGYATIDTAYTTTGATAFLGFTVAPGGVTTRNYNLISKRVAFFGSGQTNVNISTVLRNKSDLRGAQIDIVATGRKGWGYDAGWQRNDLIKKWGTITTTTDTASTATASGGDVNPAGTTV